MIPNQVDPNSPATQPYNQAPKAMNPFAGIDAFGTQPAPMQQPTQQPVQEQKPAVDPVSPMSNYGAAASIQTMGGAHMAPSTPVLGYGNTPTPNMMNMMQPVQNFSAPVTPPSQFGSGGMNQAPAAAMQQQSPSMNPFAATNNAESQTQPQPVTPTMQYSMFNGGTIGQQQPATPPAAFASNEPSFASTPGASVQNDDSFDFGPPMGSPVEGVKLNEMPESTVPVPTPNTENQDEGIVSGMGTLSVRPGQGSPEQQPYGNYATGYPTQQQPPVFAGQQNYTATAPVNNWNNGSQQQQAAYPSPSDWSPVTLQQPAPYPGQGYAGAPQGYGTQLPGLDHSPQGYHNQKPNGNIAPEQGYFSYDNVSAPAPRPYGRGAHPSPHNLGPSLSSPLQQKPRSALDEHKTAVDLTRERTSNIRALRLLEVAASEYGYTDNTGDEHGYVGGSYATHESRTIGKKLKLEKAKQLQAKELRKIKKREFRTRAQMAESTREVKKGPRGYDPELTADKCQLDFDRQRASQKKALKLMGLF